MDETPYTGPEMVPDHPKVDYSDVPPVPDGVALPNPENSIDHPDVAPVTEVDYAASS